MVHSHNGIVDIIDYFDEDGDLQKADISKLQISSDDVDYEELELMIKPYEYERSTINKKEN